MATNAPHVNLVVDRFARASLPALVAGDIDLALVGDTDALPLTGLSRAQLHADPFAVIARAAAGWFSRHVGTEGSYLTQFSASRQPPILVANLALRCCVLSKQSRGSTPTSQPGQNGSSTSRTQIPPSHRTIPKSVDTPHVS